MPITINGSGSIAGISAGGLPDGTVAPADLTTGGPNWDANGRLLLGGVSANANGGILQLSNGITFPATQSACSDVNTLDDYEEGTWTITIATESGSAYTLGGQANRYVKIGSLVYVAFNVEFTAEGSGTIAVFNLPFTASTNETFIFNGFVTQANNRMSMQYSNYTMSSFLARTDNGTAYVNYWTPNTSWAPTNNFIGSGCYSVN